MGEKLYNKHFLLQQQQCIYSYTHEQTHDLHFGRRAAEALLLLLLLLLSSDVICSELFNRSTPRKSRKIKPAINKARAEQDASLLFTSARGRRYIEVQRQQQGTEVRRPR